MTSALKIVESTNATAQPAKRVLTNWSEDYLVESTWRNIDHPARQSHIVRQFAWTFITGSNWTYPSVWVERQSTPRLWMQVMNRTLDELGRLQDGWVGKGSIAPRPAALIDLQTLTTALPLHTRVPEVEVDPSDGEVKLAWRCTEPMRSLALAMSGDKKVRAIQSRFDQELQDPFIELSLTYTTVPHVARILQTLSNQELFFGE